MSNNIPNHMSIGPADDYKADGIDWTADQIPRWHELSWERGDLLDLMPDEHQTTYIMTAEANGITYEGTGVYSCGELIEVQDIEIKH